MTSHPHPFDALTDSERAQIDALPAPQRARALLDQKKFQLSRAERRAAEEVHRTGQSAQSAQDPGSDDRATRSEFVALAADLAVYAGSEDVIAASAADPAFAQQVATLQMRGRRVTRAYVESAAQSARAAARPDPAITAAAALFITPEKFKRLVQARRRREALKKLQAAKTAKPTQTDLDRAARHKQEAREARAFPSPEAARAARHREDVRDGRSIPVPGSGVRASGVIHEPSEPAEPPKRERLDQVDLRAQARRMAREEKRLNGRKNADVLSAEELLRRRQGSSRQRR
jgi:hypothetical protein